MATVHRCDKCRREFPNKDDLTALHAERGYAHVELCDDCLRRVLGKPTSARPNTTQEIHFENANGNRMKHVQTDLTGIAPEDQFNEKE